MKKEKLTILTATISLFVLGCRKVNPDCNVTAYPNSPEREWFTSHNGSKEESHGHYILTCSDGGFLQVGETGDITKSTNILVIKTNSSGSLLWSKELSSGDHNLGNSALEINDGYIICGAQNNNSSVIKLDKANGSIIWEKSFDNGGSDAFEHLALRSNGFMAVGYKNAEDGQNTFYTQGEGYITFLNNQGDKISGKNINLSHPYRIKQFNSEYFISGLPDGATDFALFKVDSSGNQIWTKTFGGSNSDHCFGMDINNDGFVYLTGHTLSGTENWDTYTMKIDNNGVKLWEMKQGNPRGFKPKYIHDEAWGINSTGDGGCLVIAGTGDEYGRYRRRCGNEGDNSNTWNVYAIKYDSNGALEWQQTYGGGKGVDWAGEDLDITNDGEIIVAVDNGGFGFLKLEQF